VLSQWRKRDLKHDRDRTCKAFFVPADEIRGNHYDLSLNGYKEIVQEEQSFERPSEILERIKSLV
jgi:type I restriction enzyme M protein